MGAQNDRAELRVAGGVRVGNPGLGPATALRRRPGFGFSLGPGSAPNSGMTQR